MSGLALETSKSATGDNPQLTEMADRARILARDISKNVSRILSALQIGDITRQRSQHVQAGLALLDNLDVSASQLRLRAAGEMLLAAQLEAALRDYSQELAKLLPSIEGLAADAVALAALSDATTHLGDSDGLRDLKRRMDAALHLVAAIQGANGAMRYLAGRLNENGANDKGAKAKPLIAVGSGSQRHPLDYKACDLLDRVIYMEAAADDCIVILERLKEASDALIADDPSRGQISAVSAYSAAPQSQKPESQKELAEAAAGRIKAILDKAEDDMAAHAGKNTDILRLLDRAAGPAIFQAPDDDLEVGGYAGLKFNSPDLGGDDNDFGGELSVLLSKIECLYAMGQERDVHRAFAKACGLEVADERDELQDGLF